MMDLSLGNSARVVVAGGVRPRQRYGVKADGSRGAVGVETDAAGIPQAAFTATLVSGPVGWVEGAVLVAAEPLLASLPPAGSLVEVTGDLVLRVVGGDYGSTRSTVVGVTGLRPLGSATEPLNAVGAVTATTARERAAS